jgi:hypothetical protein
MVVGRCCTVELFNFLYTNYVRIVPTLCKACNPDCAGPAIDLSGSRPMRDWTKSEMDPVHVHVKSHGQL